MKPFGNLITDQPMQTDPGVIRFRAFLKMKVGMECDLGAWIFGILVGFVFSRAQKNLFRKCRASFTAVA